MDHRTHVLQFLLFLFTYPLLSQAKATSDEDFQVVIWDTPVGRICTTLPQAIMNKQLSFKSDICVVLHSKTDYNGIGDEVSVDLSLSDNSFEYLQDKVASFISCNPSDVLNEPSVVETTANSLPVETTTTSISTGSVTGPQKLLILQDSICIQMINYQMLEKVSVDYEKSWQLIKLMLWILLFIWVLVTFMIEVKFFC